MLYALLNKKIWKVLQERNGQVLLERDGEATEAPLSELNFVYPEREAIELLEKCGPHVKHMESFGDIDHLADIDGNMILPFAEDFSISDTELVDFLNETISQTDSMVKAYPNRQDYKIIALEGPQKDHSVNSVIDAFNQTCPEANTLEVIWDDQHRNVYLCTQEICNARNLVCIPIDYEEELKSRLPVFLDRTVVEGAKLLWSNVVLANVDPLKINTFEDIKDGHMHMPFGDDGRIYGKTSIKQEYLDWAVEVINEFNEIIRKGKLKSLRSKGIMKGPTYDALTRAKRAIHIPN